MISCLELCEFFAPRLYLAIVPLTSPLKILLFALLRRCFFPKGLFPLGWRGGRKRCAWTPAEIFWCVLNSTTTLGPKLLSPSLKPYSLCHAWTRREMHATVRQSPSLSFNGVVNLWHGGFFHTGKVVESNGAWNMQIFCNSEYYYIVW